MNMQVRDKVALVTGAGSGIGKAAAMLLAAEGAAVGVLSRTEAQVRAVADEIIRAGGKATALVADVSDPAQMERATDELASAHGRLDIVVANAGINGVWAPIEELTPEEWDRTLNVNLKGTFLTIRCAVSHLRAAGGGSVIIISSVNGTRILTNLGSTAYSCSKMGQLVMGQMLALELGQDNIRVNVVCPGFVPGTEIGDNTHLRNLGRIRIKGRFDRIPPLASGHASLQQVAQVVLFLASDASRHITGTPIWVDGGHSLLQG